MGEIQIVKEPEWKTFGICGDPERFKCVLRVVYENLLQNNHDYIPDLNQILDQEDSVEIEIIQPIVQLFTFGEELEYWDDAQEDALGMNLTWYKNDISHDIKLSFLSDQYFFVDEFNRFINEPFVKIW